MSLAMEPMKVPLSFDADGFHFLGAITPVLEVQKNALACHNVFLAQQNDTLRRNFQHFEMASQIVQWNRILAGPPGLTREPLQPLRLAMTRPLGLTKELVSNHSDDSTTCTLCDEMSSTKSETLADDEKPLTQVIIKHLRSDFTRAKLFGFLHAVGYNGKYDMVYLPTNLKTGKCNQYAFVNFLSEEIAQQFQMQLQGCADEEIFGQEQCEVSWSELQGLPDIIEKYRNSPIMHPDVPETCKPALFKHGQAIPFPAPTKALKRPKGFH